MWILWVVKTFAVTENSPDDPRAELWHALLAEFGKYGGLDPEHLETWSGDSKNETPERLLVLEMRP